MLTIVGEADVRPSLEIKVIYREVPMFKRIEQSLRRSLVAAPFLEYLQIDSGRDAHILYVVNGKMDSPLRDPVLDALGLKRPARLNAYLVRRIIELEAAKISQVIQEVLPDEQVVIKHTGLWAG